MVSENRNGIQILFTLQLAPYLTVSGFSSSIYKTHQCWVDYMRKMCEKKLGENQWVEAQYVLVVILIINFFNSWNHNY